LASDRAELAALSAKLQGLQSNREQERAFQKWSKRADQTKEEIIFMNGQHMKKSKKEME
jgi:hypothetical protein